MAVLVGHGQVRPNLTQTVGYLLQLMADGQYQEGLVLGGPEGGEGQTVRMEYMYIVLVWCIRLTKNGVSNG